jgi:FtsH-binding integral membrane protein
MAYDVDLLTAPARFEIARDSGLRVFLGRVYLKVAAGLALSAAVAWCVAELPALRDLVFVSAPGQDPGFTGWGLALVFSPLAVLFLASFVTRAETGRASAWLYWTVAGLVGGSLSLLVLVYTGAALVSTFLVTAAAFVGLTAWGYLTRRNLSGAGAFLVAALFGLILAMLVNLFLKSPVLDLVLNGLGVLIFAGLIAADTQRLKRIYYQTAESGGLGASSNYGALTLYLNFINLFELLLSFSGSRSRR